MRLLALTMIVTVVLMVASMAGVIFAAVVFFQSPGVQSELHAAREDLRHLDQVSDRTLHKVRDHVTEVREHVTEATREVGKAAADAGHALAELVP